MPEPDPISSPAGALKRRLWRILRLLVLLSVVVAAAAVLLVARGDSTVHPNMLIATFLGIGFTMLVGTGLMTLIFLSASSGHDDQAAARPHHEKDDDERL